MTEFTINIYELSDFADNEELIYNREAVQSIMGQLILSIANENKDIYSILYLAKKQYYDYDMEAPMAVSLTLEGATLYVNPKYFIEYYNEYGEMAFDIFKTILYHEALHIIHLHPLDTKYNKLNPHISSIAYDIVINEDPIINKEHVELSYGTTLKRINDELKMYYGLEEPMKPNMSSTYYYDIINKTLNKKRDDQNDQQDGLDNVNQLDSHDKWSENAGLTEEEVKDVIAKLSGDIATSDLSEQEKEDLAKKMDKATHGTYNILNMVKNKGIVFKLPTIKSKLTKLLRKQKMKTKTYHAYRPNDGTNIIKKGIKQIKNSSKMVYIFGDTSGSIDVENLYNIIKTISSNKDYFVPEILLFSDHVYVYDGKRTIRGGTNAQAIFDYLYNNNVDKRMGIIILTDGEIFKIQNTYGYDNVHWLLIENGTSEYLPKKHKYCHVAKQHKH